MIRDVFSQIFGQEQVRKFLRSVIARDAVSHSYLFAGPEGSQKLSAAYAFAEAILCSEQGCEHCEVCEKIKRRTHPDVVYFSPEGVSGYLAEQMQELIADSTRSPIQASKRVYIIDAADRLGKSAANAFLKTLEEPPEHLVIILLASSSDAVLPTLVSRCQVVPFHYIPPVRAAELLVQNYDTTLEQAAIAIQACAGSIPRAKAFLQDPKQRALRKRVIEIIGLLEHADDYDIIGYAQELMVLAKAPLDVLEAAFEEKLNDQADFLDKAARRRLEQQHKRELSAHTMHLLKELCFIVRSYLRDAMMVQEDCTNLVVNTDVLDSLEKLGRSVRPAHILHALSACDDMIDTITYNVSPETCLDVMLFDIREALYGADSSRRIAI